MKDKKILYGIIIAFVFLLSIGLTYAYFSVTTTVVGDRNAIEATVGTLNILYTDGPEIVAENIEPGWTTTKTIKVENTGTLTAYYSIIWNELSNEIINDELLISAICTSNGSGCENIAEQPVLSSAGEIKTNIPIEPDEEQTYIITASFTETGSEQNYNQDKAFNGALNVISSNETYMLMGTLLDSDGDPIGGATIEVHSTLRTGKTDENGVFKILGVELGSHEIDVKDSGNNSIATDSISLVSGSEAKVEGKKIISSSRNNIINVDIKLGEGNISQISAVEKWYDTCSSTSTDLRCKMIYGEKNNGLDAYPDNVSSTYVTSFNGINFSKTNDGCYVDYNTFEEICPEGEENTNGKGLYYTTNPSKTEYG